MSNEHRNLWRGTSTELVWSLDQIVDDIRHDNLEYYDLADEDAPEFLRQLSALAGTLRYSDHPVTLADVPRRYRALVGTALIRERGYFPEGWGQNE